jgi:hypothetical protein
MSGPNVVEAKPSAALSSFGARPCRQSREMGEQVERNCGNFCSWDNETITRDGEQSNSTRSTEVEFVCNNPVAICSVFLLAPMFLQPSDSHLTWAARSSWEHAPTAAGAQASRSSLMTFNDFFSALMHSQPHPLAGIPPDPGSCKPFVEILATPNPVPYVSILRDQHF